MITCYGDDSRGIFHGQYSVAPPDNLRMPEIERKYKIECEEGFFYVIFGKPQSGPQNMVKYGDMDALYSKTCFRFAGSWVCSLLIPYSDCIGQHARAMDGDALVALNHCIFDGLNFDPAFSSWFHCMNSRIAPHEMTMPMTFMSEGC